MLILRLINNSLYNIFEKRQSSLSVFFLILLENSPKQLLNICNTKIILVLFYIINFFNNNNNSVFFKKNNLDKPRFNIKQYFY